MKKVIEEIKESIDIVDYIGRSVNLSKVGSYYRGLCPFHSDNDPSFYVNPKKKFYHCFGCGEKGDIITFIQKTENLSFIEALEKLSSISGIQLPETKRDKNYSLYESLRHAVNFYHNNLLNEKNRETLKFLRENRKISDSTINEFKLGLSKDNNLFQRYLKTEMNVDENFLFRTGLFYRKNGVIAEKYDNRIIIPIDNLSGKTVGLGGRILPGSNGAKYINSSESPIFKKSFLLFNAHRAFPIVKVLDFCIIVEGYFDVISLWNKGIKNTIGVLGTNLTTYHLKNIKNFTNNVMVFFDSDNAGMEATLKAVNKLEENGFSVATVLSNKYKDPGELCEKENYEFIKSVIGGAISGCEFKVHYFSKKVQLNSVEGKRKLITLLKPFIMKYLKLGDELNYRKIIKILSEKTGLNEDILIRGLRGSKKTVGVDRRKKFGLKERELLSIFFNGTQNRSRVIKILENLVLSEKLKKILPYMKKNMELEEIAGDLNGDERAALIEISDVEIEEEKEEKILEEYENAIRQKSISKDLETIKRELLNEKNPERKRELLLKSIELRKKIN